MRKLINIFFDEFRQICHDEGVLLFVILLPIAYPILYSFIYDTETQRDVPICVVDECNSSQTREYIRKIDATPDVKIERVCLNMQEAQEMMKQREVYAILQIPRSFSRDLWEGKQTMVALFSDLTSMLIYKVAYVGVVNVTQDMNRQIKVSRMQLTTRQEEKVAQMPVDFRHVMLYNPQGGFAAFLIPSVLMLIIQQALCLGVGMSVGRSRERFGRRIIPRHPDYSNPVIVILGKALVYVLIFLVMAIYMNVCVSRWFGFPEMTHFWSFIEFFVPYVLSCTFMAMFWSLLIYQREDCILLFVFMSVPLLFLSGISWPGASIPTFLKAFGLLFPSTTGINCYVRIACEGAQLDDCSERILRLWILAAGYFLMVWVIYARAIRKLKTQKP